MLKADESLQMFLTQLTAVHKSSTYFARQFFGQHRQLLQKLLQLLIAQTPRFSKLDLWRPAKSVTTFTLAQK